MKVMKLNSSQNLMVLYKVAIYQLRNQYNDCLEIFYVEVISLILFAKYNLNIHDLRETLDMSKSEVKEPIEFD